MSAAIRAALSVYDDAALEALANRGLVRRAAKDVEAGKVAIAEEGAAAIAILADGERVEIGVDGPRAARCTCPATTVCRHKLAAVLLLRAPTTPPSEELADTATPSPASSPAPALDPVADVLAVDPAALTRWAGKANIRAALELIADAAPVIELDGAALRVRLGAGWPPVLILGGQISGPPGLDSIVSKAAPTRLRSLHSAAVLAVWRTHGRDLAGLIDELTDAAVPEPPDATFLATVKATLEHAVSTAISQAPEVLEEQLFLLSVSSRADDLPALSRRLRQLSGSIRARRDRDFTLQPAEILSSLANAYALVDALSSCHDPMVKVPLRGVIRQGYAPVGPLSLVGLAARLWETRGGARGVTGYFYSPEMKRVVTVALARAGEHDRMFNPATAFHDEKLWRAGPLRELIGARVDLQGARLSQEGRLSLAQETVGWKTAWKADADEVRGWPIAFDDWQKLQAEMQDRLAVRLTARREATTLVALLPTAHLPPRFDTVNQRTVLPVQDSQGFWLALQVPHSTASAGTAQRLEVITTGARIEMAFVEIVPTGELLLPLPLALMSRATPDADPVHELVEPRLAQATDKAATSDAQDDDQSRGSPVHQVGTARGLLVSEIQDALLACAELGLPASTADSSRQFAAFEQRARDMGLGTLADSCSTVARADKRTAASAALRLAHLCDRLISFGRRLPLM